MVVGAARARERAGVDASRIGVGCAADCPAPKGMPAAVVGKLNVALMTGLDDEAIDS